MKKTLIAALLGFSALAQAHEVWVATLAQITSNSVLKADLAYGDYPYVEKIPEKRLAIFPPMELINQDGEMQTLVQKGKLPISIRKAVKRRFILGNSYL